MKKMTWGNWSSSSQISLDSRELRRIKLDLVIIIFRMHLILLIRMLLELFNGRNLVLLRISHLDQSLKCLGPESTTWSQPPHRCTLPMQNEEQVYSSPK